MSYNDSNNRLKHSGEIFSDLNAWHVMIVYAIFIFGLSISLSGLTNNSTSKMSVTHKSCLSIYTLFDNL